jgi:hypothetical protein
MPRVGFKPTMQVFKRAKMVHALDRGATVISWLEYKLEMVLMEAVVVSFEILPRH